MKKISMMLLVAVALFVTGCNGSGKKAEATDANEKTEVTKTEAKAEGSDVLKKYEEFVEKAIPLLKKVKSGDASAAQEYTKIAEELGKFVMDNQDAFTKLSEADAKKYAELSQKLAAAAQ